MKLQTFVNLLLVFLISQIGQAGTNTLVTETGPVIQLSHVNKFKTALSGDLVPRNSSGVATNDAASLGSSTYRFSTVWGDGFHFQRAAGSNSVTLQAPSGLVSNYSLTLLTGLPANTQPILLSSSGAMSSTRLLTDNIADLQVTNAKLADTSVTTAKIVDSNVTTAKIADANVTSAKIQSNVDLAGLAVKENGKNLVVANTNATGSLAIVRISVVANGTLGSGEGASINRTGLGVYVLTFTTAFGDTPTVAISPRGIFFGFCTGSSISGSAVTVTCRAVDGTTPQDTDIGVIAIGQRT